MNFQDKTLKCRDCGQDFTWKAGEQEFFSVKGFSAPTRCKDCRRKKKEARSETSHESKYKITCSSCGKIGEVPFQPRNPQGVLCAECFEKARMAHGS